MPKDGMMIVAIIAMILAFAVIAHLTGIEVGRQEGERACLSTCSSTR